MSEVMAVQNPFPGLRPFKTEESTLFFGRDDQIGEALDRLLRQKLLVVVGVSGCGKSSLVIAGMIPALEMGLAGNPEQHWRVVAMRPGDGPLRELSRCLGFGEALAERTYGLQEAVETHLPAGHNLLLVVDQFEELFPFRDRKLRAGAGSEADLFVSYLLRSAQDQAGRVYVLLTMRSDYLGECAKFHGLPEALNDGQYLVPRMTRQQLQEAIEGPLEASAVKMHPALVQELLNQCDEEPDNLPLLQHLLRRMFEQWMAEGGQGAITSGMATGVGGLAGALNQDAEKVCAGLSPEELNVAEVLFRRITESRRQADTAEDDRPVRRPQTIETLARLARVDETLIRTVVGQFEQRGLLVVRQTDQGDKVDLPHECLCLRWTRLKDWILAEAEDAKKLRFLWDATERKAPLAGLALTEALEWQRNGRLNTAWCSRYLKPEQITAVAAWMTESQRISTEGEARERLTQEAESRSRRWTKAVLLLSVMTAAFGGLGIWALQQSGKANTEAMKASNEASKAARASADANQAKEDAVRDRNRANAAEQEAETNLTSATKSEEKAEAATARAVKSERTSRDLAELYLSAHFATRSDTVFREEPAGLEKAVLLAVESAHWRPSLDGDKALRQCMDLLPVSRVWNDGGVKPNVSVSATSRDGKWMAIGGDDNSVRVTEIATGKEVYRLRHQGKIRAVALSSDGHWLATGSDDKTARIVDMTAGKEVARLPHQGAVLAVAFTLDEKKLETWSAEGPPRVVDLPVNHAVPLLNQSEANALAFSPDGKYLATGSKDKSARVLDLATGKVFRELKYQDEVNAVAFSSDGRLWTSRTKDAVRVMNLATGKDAPGRADPRLVYAIAFSPDGRFQAAGGEDKTARVTELTTGQSSTIKMNAAVYAVAFSPDGKYLAIGDESFAVMWDLALGREKWRVNHPGRVYAAAFSADGKWLATGGGTTAMVTEVATGHGLHRVDVAGGIFAAARFSRDGRWLETVHQVSEDDKGLIYSRHLLDTQALVREACEKLTRNLTTDEWQHYAGAIPYRRTCDNLPTPAARDVNNN